MESNGVASLSRRRNRAEANRLVFEFERSGVRRKEFCAAHGVAVHRLDAWRRRRAQTGSGEKIVPVEIVEDRGRPASEARNGQFRIVLAEGLRIEIEGGFDAAELRRLIIALNGGDLRSGLA